jgi:hypothetical protein
MSGIAITLFDRQTRRVLQVMHLPAEQAAAQCSESVGMLEGAWPADRYRVHAERDEAVLLEAADTPAVHYAAARALEYPATQPQLAALWQAIEALANGEPLPEEARAMLTEIARVKGRWPKP